MIFLGIDPGITGALAIIPNNGMIEFYDTPVAVIKSGKKMRKQMDIATLQLILQDIVDRFQGETIYAVIEKVTPMPSFNKGDDPETERRTMGATSAFNFGKGVGIWLGLLTGLKIPYEEVHPVRWKKNMMPDQGKEKDASRVKAMQLFPSAAKDLNLKKHHGRSDALLIAAYGKRFCGTGENLREKKGESTLFNEKGLAPF